jgi:xylulokinase
MYFLGIDVSTTATKALLIDSSGTVLAVWATEYSFETPRPLWSEQHPDLWWDGTQKSIRAVLEMSGVDAAQIGGIGLTGQMHGLVLLDETGNVLRPSILWNDQRTQAQCDEIHRRVGRERFIQITGNVALTGFTAPKILWVKENEPEVYSRVAHVLLPKDFVRYKLTGAFAMDKADGAGTVLMDLKKRDWSNEVLSVLEIPRVWMPPLFEGTDITGTITPEAAAATGLAAGTPVMAGGGGSRQGRRNRLDPWNQWGGLCHDRRRHHRTGGPPACLLPLGSRPVAPHGCHVICRWKPTLVSRHFRCRHEL